MKKRKVKIGRKMTNEEFNRLTNRQKWLSNLYKNTIDVKEKHNIVVDIDRNFDRWFYEDIRRQTGMNKEEWIKHFNENEEGEGWKN